MSAAHTPGPWLIRQGDEWTHDVVTLEGENIDGEPLYWNVASASGRRDEVKANLRLIAAAPDLLEALQAVLPFIPTTSAAEGGAAKYSEYVRAADMVRAAIAKAVKP